MGLTSAVDEKTHLLDMIKGDITPGTAALAWTGQAGFIIRGSRVSIAVDLYLSDVLAEKYRDTLFPHIRMADAPVTAQQLSGCLDLLLCSHAHSDHMDPGMLKLLYGSPEDEASPICIVPRYDEKTAGVRGVPDKRLKPMNSGETAALEHAAVTALASAHEELVNDESGNSKYLGYVIEVEGIRVYHSGDCVPYPGLEQKLSSLNIDAALLPVNGRDEYRFSHGVPGNFTVKEACALVRGAGIPFWIPHHFGMFAENSVEKEVIIQELEAWGFHEGDDCMIPEIGKIYYLSKEQ